MQQFLALESAKERMAQGKESLVSIRKPWRFCLPLYTQSTTPIARLRPGEGLKCLMLKLNVGPVGVPSESTPIPRISGQPSHVLLDLVIFVVVHIWLEHSETPPFGLT